MCIRDRPTRGPLCEVTWHLPGNYAGGYSSEGHGCRMPRGHLCELQWNQVLRVGGYSSEGHGCRMPRGHLCELQWNQVLRAGEMDLPVLSNIELSLIHISEPTRLL